MYVIPFKEPAGGRQGRELHPLSTHLSICIEWGWVNMTEGVGECTYCVHVCRQTRALWEHTLPI
jgi:hypothetical protein